MTAPSWLTAFLDLTADRVEAGSAFWAAVTGSSLSSPRGEHAEFATLVPADGDAFLRVQRVLDGPGGMHLDLHVDDPRAAADEAVDRGATQVTDLGDVVVLRSPGGLLFCTVPGGDHRKPAPAAWPGGVRSIADQVALDIPAGAFDLECAFWADVTGWELQGFEEFPEFRHLLRPSDMSIRLLLQRLGEETGNVRAHLDFATDDRAAEVRRHEALGATVQAENRWWTVLRDPVGTTYCITDRDPDPKPGR